MRLICSAWDKETEAIGSEPGLVKLSLGIGFLEAYARLRDFLTENESVESICFVGTAGAYDDFAGQVKLGDVFEIDSVGLLHLSLVQGLAYLPGAYETLTLALFEALPRASALSALTITANKDISAEILAHYKPEGILLENMELYGVAKAARDFDVPCSARLAVSNFTFGSAHQEWLDNHEQVSIGLV